MLGAVIGGLVAGEVGRHSQSYVREKKQRQDHRHHREEGNGGMVVLLSTVGGAVVGGLGVNALERWVESKEVVGKEGHGGRDDGRRG